GLCYNEPVQKVVQNGGSKGRMATFGQWLKAQRKAHDLTQQALAEQAGYALETIVKIETGAGRPSQAAAERLGGGPPLPPGERAAFLRAARAGAAPPAAGAGAIFTQPGPARLYPPLPAPPNAFIGREHELAALTALLRRAGVRLVTVLGPPGVGKTRLAL